MLMIQVNVTSEDIAKGLPSDLNRCPIALAMYRALNAIAPDKFEVSICTENFRIYDNHNTYEYNMPAIGSKFIRAFDIVDTRPYVGPFHFEFDLHEDNRTLARRQMYLSPHYLHYMGSDDWAFPKKEPTPVLELPEVKTFDEELKKFMSDYVEVVESILVTK